MRDFVPSFWRDDRGAEEQISKLLVFAFIAIPLIALIIIYKDKIIGWANQIWQDTFSSPPAKPNGPGGTGVTR
ncbi:MAG: hypothetical protein R3F56_00295 [Planctomycetota bacterium]